MLPDLSIIVPTLNEASIIVAQLEALQVVRHRDGEVLIIDGGSEDDTVRLARPLADVVIAAPRGRAAQMNAGACIARGKVLVFLHADTKLPEGAADTLCQWMANGRSGWGRFDVLIEGRHPMLRLIAWCMNLRSRVTGIATGDQAIFVRRELFWSLGGFPNFALMEDVALATALRRIARPTCLSQRVVTSGRRWEKGGVIRTTLLMWLLSLAYLAGFDPDRLAHLYGYAPRRP